LRRRRPRRPGRIISYLGLFLILIVGFYGWRYFASRVPPVVGVPPASAPQEDVRREVEKVAEKIRAAHLNKDINKWLSCYNSTYPSLGRLENQMLELWKNYDIKEVNYRIANVQRQGERQATAEIVWNIQLWDHRTHDYTLVRSGYKILLEKSDGGWKILDSKEEGGAS
jgi:hypothetical protein